MLDVEVLWGGQSHDYKLQDGEHAVGRAGDNAIKLPVPRVSKHHAVVRVDGERLFVRDLGSTNGTDLDGRPVGRDEVEVPPTATLSFAGALLNRAGHKPKLSAGFLADNEVNTLMRYNIRDGYSEKARDRIVGMSAGIFEILASEEDGSEVGRAACEFVATAVTADRVVMLEDHGEATTIEQMARWTRKEGDEGAPLHLSQTLIGQVLRERDSVLVSNPLEDPNYIRQASVMALSLRSAMAAPLFDNERVRGILYVDTADSTVRYDKDDLQVLTATANAVAVKLRNLSLESEIRTAARLQRAMLPVGFEPPAGYELEGFQVMCRQVGGDLFYFRRRPNGKILIALGDVSGKGMPAALAMSAATVLIGLLTEIGGELEEIAQHLHKQLFKSFIAERFITLFLGELEAETGRMRYVNAGHEPPLIVSADGAISSLKPTGMPIALVDEPVLGGDETTLAKGDLVAVFSDGVPEATTDGERFLGLDSVKEILKANRNRDLATIRKLIIEDVDEFLAGEPHSDDVTVILLRRAG